MAGERGAIVAFVFLIAIAPATAAFGIREWSRPGKAKF
jgi:hypothetical protein